MNTIAVAVCVYIALQFAIGYWVSRNVRTEADYILGGRQIGLGLTAFSVFATWFGAETVLGASGRAYKDGLSGVQGEPIAYAVGIVIMGVFFAAPLWNRGITTFADFFRERFAPSIERLTAVLLIPGSVLWAAAQTRALGQIMGSTAGMDPTLAISIAALVVVAYTAFGGLLADVYTDALQGTVIILGLGALFLVIASETGGVGAGLATVEPARWHAFGASQSWLDYLEQWAIPLCGSIVAIELISRILACRTAGIARSGAGLGALVYLAVAMMPVFMGLVGPKLAPALADPEQLVPELAKSRLSTVLYIVFIGALISAILSTVSSALLAAGSLVAHNLVGHWGPETAPDAKLRIARLCVAALGVVAFFIALAATSISELVELASSFASAGVFVALVFGLFTSFGGPLAALSSLLAGAGIWAWGKFLFGLKTPYLTALAAAFLAYVVVAAIERRDRRDL